MSEFLVKTATWRATPEELPEIGKTVEVLATMITEASLVSTEPKQMWNQDQDLADAQIEVKLWRYVDDAKAEV